MHTLVLFVWLALCAWQDAAHRRISNWLTLGGCALALVWLSIAGTTWLGARPVEAAFAAFLALLLTLPGYWLKRLGAGDVKLLLFIALTSTPRTLLFCIVGAGAAYLVWAMTTRRLWHRIPSKIQRYIPMLAPEHRHEFPFAPFLLVGFLTDQFHFSP